MPEVLGLYAWLRIVRAWVMLRVLALTSTFVIGTLLSWAPEPAPAPEPEPKPKVCCKTCRKGKACGDSCIARDKDCGVEAGCACDADDSSGDR